MAYQNGKTYYLIPTCATGDAAYNQKILNKQIQPLSLNIQGTGNHYNNRNVNVYPLDWSTDMQWKVMVYDGYARILCAGNTAFGLDYYYGSSNPGNCDIYKVSGNEEDSKINFRTINASENLYRIQCYRNNADNDLYLTVTGTANGADVRWQPLDSSKATQQTWWLVPIENISENTTPTPTVPNTPSEIKDHEFFVKAYGTDLYLNVYGTDTVAPGRNVTVYTKENCDAQKWIAKQETAGPKLFTSINQAYALNIDTSNNNCTMYTASGNDNDSVLYFEEMGDMLYRIKMHNHNKYLHVDTEAESSDNVYWVSDINSATYWEFIPESVVFPQPSYPYGAIRHYSTGEVYPIALYENFKEYIEPAYEFEESKTYYKSDFSLIDFVTSLEFDDSFISTGSTGGLIASIVQGVISALCNSMGSTSIKVDFYRVPGSNVKKAHISCHNTNTDSLFASSINYGIPNSYKTTLKNKLGVFYDENEANQKVTELYETMTGKTGNADYDYDIKYYFNRDRRTEPTYTGIVVGTDGFLYEYFFLKEGEKTYITVNDGIFNEIERVDITEKVSQFAKADEDIMEDFNIKFISP